MKIIIALALLCFLASINASKLDRPSSYIINGEDVSGVVPFYAYLEIYELPDLEGNIFFGGATLISVQVLVTVAQNVVGFQSWFVGLGGYRIQDLEWHIVDEAHVHAEYDDSTLGNNIAVLRLINPVTLSTRIFPITRLPTGSNLPSAGTSLDIVGFGFGETDNQPMVLQQAQLTVISESECGTAFPHLVINELLDNHFCARNVTTSSNICAGDQGGPIFSPQLNTLVGIQSFIRRAECGDIESHPAAFIRVHQHNDFINRFL